MKKNMLIALLACAQLASAAQFQTLEHLTHAFPAVIEYDHSAELLSLEINQSPEVMTADIEKIDDMPFEQCRTLDIKKPGANLYAINIIFKEENQWKVGDAGIVAFYCRTLNTENRFGASSLRVTSSSITCSGRIHVLNCCSDKSERSWLIQRFQTEACT